MTAAAQTDQLEAARRICLCLEAARCYHDIGDGRAIASIQYRAENMAG